MSEEQEHRGPGRPPRVIGPTILIKGENRNWKDFFGPVSKGSAKPAFTSPSRVDGIKAERDHLKKQLDSGLIHPSRRMEIEERLTHYNERVDKFRDEKDAAKELYMQDRDHWDTREKDLRKEIEDSIPPAKMIEKKKVNPHVIFKAEQGGLKEKKLEWQTIRSLQEEDTDLTYLGT